MTEDNTFRRLQRIPAQEMYYKWLSCSIPPPNLSPSRQVEEFFAQYGWTYLEFMEYEWND